MFRPGQDLPPLRPSGPPPRAPSPGMMNIGPPQYTPPPLPGMAFVLSPFATGHSRFPPPPPVPMASGQPPQPSTHSSVQLPQPPMQSHMQPPMQPRQSAVQPPQPPVQSSVQPSQSFIPSPQLPMQPPQPPMQPRQQAPFIPPLPGSPPADVPPPPPSGPPPQPPSPPPLPPVEESDQLDQSNANPPRMPSDPEMVKNIEVLAAFVVKNGPEFELMARAKQAGDPKFAFLFGNGPGTEAAIGHEYYKWKKQNVESQMQQETESKANKSLEIGKASESVSVVKHLAGKSVMRKDVPGSPTVSDMDMEDDFTLPSLRKETGGQRQLKESRSVLKEDFRESRRMEAAHRGESQLDETRDVSKEGIKESIVNRIEVVDLHLPYSEEDEDSGENQFDEPGAGFELDMDDDLAMLSPKEDIRGERQLKDPTPVPKEDFRETITIRMETDASAMPSPKEEISGERQLKDPTPVPEENIRDHITSRMEIDSALASPKEELSVERQFKEPRTGSEEGIREDIRASMGNRGGESFSRSSRWGPPQPVEGVIVPSGMVALDNRGSPTEVFEKRRKLGDAYSSPDISFNEMSDSSRDWDRRATVDKTRERDSDRKSSRADYHQRQDQGAVAVDEFGRIKREGSDERELDEDPRKLVRRRSYSRSRSRSWSPGESRWRRQSISRSPRRWGRRSRSHSRSPRWRRSRSRTPPRDSRWVPLGRGDRDFHERGRRGGRGPGQHVCFDFTRGKCFRGASCRYFHQENVGIGDSGGRCASGNRNRGWRETGIDHQRSWATRSVTPPVAMVESMVEEEKIIKQDVEATSEPQDGLELRQQSLTPEEEKRDEVSQFGEDDTEKPASPGKTIDEESKASDKVDVPAKPSSPPSLSPDGGSSPHKPSLSEPPISLDQPLPVVTSVSSLPLVILQPSPSSVEETTSIAQHAAIGNSTLQSSFPRVPLISSRISTLNTQHSLPMGRSVPTGTSSFLQPISIRQPRPFENLQFFQQPRQPFARGNPTFSQPPPFPGNSLHPRPPFVTNHRPPVQPVYQASVPFQLGIATNLPQQHIPGPNVAVPQQHIPGPNLAVPQQHIPGPNLAVPQQHIPGPNLAVPQQHIPGPNLAVPQQHIPGPNLAVPQQHIPGTNLTVPQQHNFQITSSHPTNFLGHEPRFQQRGITPIVTTTTNYVQHGFNPLPERGFNSLPERGFNPLTEQGFNPLPEQGFNPLPERGFNPLPERSFNPFPERGFNHPISEQGFNSLPEQGLNSLPEQSFNALPERGVHSLSERGFHSLPERGLNPIPDQGFGERTYSSMPAVSAQPSFPRPFVGDASSQFTFPHLVKTGGQSGVPSITPTTTGSPVIQNPPPVTMSWMVPTSGSLGAHSTLVQQSPPARPDQVPSLKYPLPGVSAVTGLLPIQSKPALNNSAAGEQYDPLADSIEPDSAGGLLAWTKPLQLKLASQDNVLTDGQSTDNSMRINMHINAPVPALESLSPGQATEKLEAISPKVRVGLASEHVATKLTGADETAATGVGVVENVSPPDDNRNWSPCQPVEEATGTGEVETGQDQVQSKLKKSKEGRGLKLLRASVAEYVKDVLKPTWREGQMSKEAFKTIAKKAVEKVTGNIPSHHIPKSQEKVDQYMSSSRTKIAKLVQGYVDKYLKT